MMCIALMALALVVLWTIQKDAKAEEEKGSITIELDELSNKKGPTDRKGVEFAIYLIGGWNGTEGKWELKDDLNKIVELDKLLGSDDVSLLAESASKLIREGNLKQYEITGNEPYTTDENGLVEFNNLDLGIYLIQQISGEETYGTVTPLMVTIPYFNVDGTRTVNVHLQPKASAPIIYEAGRIEVTKKTGYMDQELLEVIDLIPSNAVYYVGIFRDPKGEVPYGKDYVKEIRMQGTSSGTAVFDRLDEGTYYIFETDSEGNPYQIGEVQPINNNNPYTWVCNLDEGSSQIVTLDGKAESPAGTVGLYNLYYDLPEGYYYQGSIKIGKKVLNRKEKQTTVDDTFYAGIFRDAEAKDLYQVVELEQNGTVTVDVPLGGEAGQDPITYYVYETDKDGKRLNKNTFGYTVTGEGKVNIEQGKQTAEISLTNTKKKAATDGSDDKDTDSSTSKKTSSKKTGDDTPIAFYVVIFVAALAVLVLMTRSRSLKGRNKHE